MLSAEFLALRSNCVIPLATGQATPLFFEEAKKQVGAPNLAVYLFGLWAAFCGLWAFCGLRDLSEELRAIGLLGYRVQRIYFRISTSSDAIEQNFHYITDRSGLNIQRIIRLLCSWSLMYLETFFLVKQDW